MSVYAIRSVTLSTNTADAWKEGGVRLARRGLTTNEILLYGRDYDAILNLGKTSFRPDTSQIIWNHGANIESLVYPGPTREMLGEYLPPVPTSYPARVWVKAPGAHGRGKYMVDVDQPLVLPDSWDWCNHIEGQEYRLVTVGDKVVQDFIRHGNNDNRSYSWLPMREVPTQLKEMVKEAARRVPGDNVLAWDTIIDENNNPFIFEANTCPGVNTSTVRRIVAEMKRQMS